MEEAQGTTVVIRRITYFGSRRVEDFDKYEALRLAEDLVSVAKTSGNTKTPSYEIIASTLHEKVSVSTEHFKAYFLALLADKEFSRIIDTSLRSIKLLSVQLPINEAPNLAEEDFP